MRVKTIDIIINEGKDYKNKHIISGRFPTKVPNCFFTDFSNLAEWGKCLWWMRHFWTAKQVSHTIPAAWAKTLNEVRFPVLLDQSQEKGLILGLYSHQTDLSTTNWWLVDPLATCLFQLPTTDKPRGKKYLWVCGPFLHIKSEIQA